MSREDLKDIICRVIEEMTDESAPQVGCIWNDNNCDAPCDVTTFYAVGEEG